MLHSTVEAQPRSYPVVGDVGVNLPVVWQRIEHYIRWRWNPRHVEWIVSGPCEFVLPLKPASISKFEVWQNGQFETLAALPKTPRGYQLDRATYRITAEVGSNDAPPEAVTEACRRLDAYMADVASHGAGLTSESDGDYSYSRTANHAGRALQYSGAADLLRAYR